jgi:hypothetical protein
MLKSQERSIYENLYTNIHSPAGARHNKACIRKHKLSIGQKYRCHGLSQDTNKQRRTYAAIADLRGRGDSSRGRSDNCQGKAK